MLQNVHPVTHSGRSSNQAMERGPGHDLGLTIMTTLTYRGKTYSQSQEKQIPQKELIQLTYRRNIYTQRQAEAQKANTGLTYRGVQYNK